MADVIRDRRFIVLWDMGSYCIIGFEDGEIACASREQLRRVPPQYWRSRIWKRAEGDPTAEFFRAPIDRQGEPVRPSLDRDHNIPFTASFAQDWEVIGIKQIALPTDAVYYIRVGYGPRSHTWVCGGKPERTDIGIWGAGLSLAPEIAESEIMQLAEQSMQIEQSAQQEETGT